MLRLTSRRRNRARRARSLATRPIERITRRVSGRLARLSADIEMWRIQRAVARDAGADALRIFSYTMPAELCALHKLASECPHDAAVIEIGAHLGASTCFLASGLSARGGRLFSVDTWMNDAMPDGQHDTFERFQHNTQVAGAHITPVRKRSQELEAEDLRIPLALAFIDGDHSYEAVRADFRCISKWMAPGGVVAFHDASGRFPGVTRVIGEALESGLWSIAGRVETLLWLKRRA